MLDVPVLETDRLILRPWRPESDAQAVFAYAGNPEATRYMLFDTHKTIHDSEAFLEWTKGSPEHAYAVTVKGNDFPIGGCGLMYTQVHNKAELGYILHPDHWNKGYATELARRLIRYGFEVMRVHRIFARADIRNPASRRVMEKAGMQFEGVLREDIFVRGQPVSLAHYSILRSEFCRE